MLHGADTPLIQSFVLSGVGLAFRSPLPQLVQVQVRLNEALVTTLVYADDCQIYSGTCYPLGNIVDYEVQIILFCMYGNSARAYTGELFRHFVMPSTSKSQPYSCK